MTKSALIGAVVLAMAGSFNVSTSGIAMPAASAQEIVITYGHIARLRSALRLTPDQIRHWRPVEAALRSLARHRASDDEDASLYQRVKNRAHGYASRSLNVGRLASVAQPLINSLDEEQKRNGMNVIRAMGMASLL